MGLTEKLIAIMVMARESKEYKISDIARDALRELGYKVSVTDKQINIKWD